MRSDLFSLFSTNSLCTNRISKNDCYLPLNSGHLFGLPGLIFLNTSYPKDSVLLSKIFPVRFVLFSWLKWSFNLEFRIAPWDHWSCTTISGLIFWHGTGLLDVDSAGSAEHKPACEFCTRTLIALAFWGDPIYTAFKHRERLFSSDRHPDTNCILPGLPFFKSTKPYYAWCTGLEIGRLHFSGTSACLKASVPFTRDSELCQIAL